MTIWQDLVSLMRESVLVQGAIALLLSGVAAYALLTGVKLGNDFWTMYGLVMGFYFGSKSTQATTNALREAVKNIQVGR